MQNRFEKGTFTGNEMISCRTLYKANGYSEEDFDRPVIGICNSFADLVPGHRHLRALSEEVKHGIYRAGGTPVEFGCISVCDGVCTTHDGSRYSLPSREVTADGIEIMARAHRMDGLVLIGSCDKTVPGMLMAAARLDIPCIFLAGGCMLGGPAFGALQKTNSTTPQEAEGMLQAGAISVRAMEDLSEVSCPTVGSCQHMATANSMCCIAEVLGMSLPGTAAIPAVYNARTRAAFHTGETIVSMVLKGITARDLITEESLRNAIMFLLAAGGSTNCVLHLSAIADEIGIPPHTVLEWIDSYADTVPLLVKISPSSAVYDAEDFYKAGGVPEVLRQLRSVLYGNCLTVTGRTLSEEIRSFRNLYGSNPQVISTMQDPFSKLAGIAVMRGSLAPSSGVSKPAAIAPEVRVFEGKAVCYDGEEAANQALAKRQVKAGDVVVIRYAGPKGAPGMPEMYKPMKLLHGQGLDKTTAVITDGRFSGTNNGCFVGHISPEAAAGGPIALVRDGDRIRIDVENRRVDLLVSEEELAKRREQWSYTAPVTKGILRRYARDVQSADEGGVLR